MVSVVDFDGGTYTSVDQMLERGNCRMVQLPEGIEGSLQPCIAVSVIADSGTATLAQPPSWIDCAYTGVNHYGLYLGTRPTSGVVGVSCEFTYHIALINSR